MNVPAENVSAIPMCLEEIESPSEVRKTERMIYADHG